MSELTVAQLLDRHEGTVLGLSLRWAASGLDHASRADLLESMIDNSYRYLIANRHLFHSLSEDQLTGIVIGQLCSLGVEASHDTQVGGHCDILVRHKGGFLWIAEAKLSNGPDYIMGGFRQLSTRYAVALDGQNRCELIVYCVNKSALLTLRNWQENLSESELGPVLIEDATDRSQLWFRTAHDCPTSGLPIRVRHSIVPLHFAPTR